MENKDAKETSGTMSINSNDVLKFLKEFEKENINEIPPWVTIAQKPIPDYVSKLLFWLFLLMLPFVAIMGSWTHPIFLWKDVFAPLIPVFLCLLTFFLNQVILVPKLFFRRRVKSFVAINLFISLLFITLRDVILCVIMDRPEGSVYYFLFLQNLSHPVGRAILIILLFFLVTFVISVFNIILRIAAIQAHFAYWMRVRENVLLQSDLLFLRQQLSPHFLFNTLNNITSLMDIDVKKAQKSMVQLSSLLRQILYETKEVDVPVANEIEVLEKYLALERLRFGSNVECRLDFSLEEPTIKIAPLLMMPLVENAIKYGVHPIQPCSIEISVHEKGGKLSCQVKNMVVPRASSTQTKSGIGLANLKRRLDVCYPGSYVYTAKEENGFYIADLEISLVEQKKGPGLAGGAFKNNQKD
ncbi:MAG: histidine kinase [Fibrobacteraceae bacterium]|nr:histidine kinase [Fibrobacteraceae bacterium]